MNKQQLFENIKRKKSFLCVGLDTDIKKIPEHLLKEEDPIFAFNKAIIDATADLCIAYKPNLAFYESMGVKGWIAFEKTVKYIKENYPDQFISADAKRGDIGNTSAMYARTFFDELDIDSVTVAPYMGEDSVTPFLTYEGKWGERMRKRQCTTQWSWKKLPKWRHVGNIFPSHLFSVNLHLG